MRQQPIGLPRLQDDETQFPGRLHTQSKKLKFGSTYRAFIQATENFNKKTPKQSPVADSQILKQIDTKLEQHKKDIEQRNDMILTIEKGFESVRQELVREKLQSEEKNRLIQEMNNQFQIAQTKLKNLQELQDKNIEVPQSDITQFEQQYKKMQEKNQQLQHTQDTLNEQLNDITIKLNAYDGKDEDQQKKLKESLRKADEKNSKLIVVQDQLKITLESLVSEKGIIKKQIDQIKLEGASKEAILQEELINAQIKLKELQKDKNILVEGLKTQSNLNEQNQKLNETIIQLKQQFQELQKEKDKQMNNLKNEYEIEIKNFNLTNDQITEFKQKNENMKKIIIEKQSLCEQFNKQQYDKQIKEQEKQIIELNNKLEELKLKGQNQKPKNLQLISDTIQLLEKTHESLKQKKDQLVLIVINLLNNLLLLFHVDIHIVLIAKKVIKKNVLNVDLN